MTDRALLLCAGNATRWGSHDTPKQLMPLRGEPILHRAARLLAEFVAGVDVKIVVKDARDDLWKVPGTSRTTAKLDPARAQADKLLSSRHLWSTTGRTFVLFGDVYFTEVALQVLVDDQRSWCALGRSGGSSFTGTDHRELFGFAFDPSEHEALEAAALRCLELHRAGKMGGWSGGWQIYAAMAGADDEGVSGRFRDRGNFIDVDDWTDDLDRPRDWHQWCWRWARADLDRRAVGHC